MNRGVVVSSAHKAGAGNWAHSHRVMVRRREAVLDQQRELKVQRDAYLQRLATKLMQECGLSETVALARVRAFSVSATKNR
jgi:hypothetical protein